MRKTGTNTGTIVNSPRYRRKQARRRKAEEARWAALSGPVIIIKKGVAPPDNEPGQVRT